jgi:dihydropteroate synthase
MLGPPSTTDPIAGEGADIIDVGRRSTRPSAAGDIRCEEIERVVPVIRELAAKLDVPISVDTHKAAVAAEALTAGASIVNDISALRFDQKMAELVAKSGAGVVLMHIQGTPQNMQFQPHYRDLLAEIHNYLESAIANAERGRIDRAQNCCGSGPLVLAQKCRVNFVLFAVCAILFDLGFLCVRSFAQVFLAASGLPFEDGWKPNGRGHARS